MFKFKACFLLVSFVYCTYAYSNGSLTVYCGSMCSGKTEEAIRCISRQFIANPTIIGVFKPLLDNRKLTKNEKDPSRFIASRNGGSVACEAVVDIAQMRQIVMDKHYTIIAIDEAQFFNRQDILNFVHEMLTLNKKIIIFGLDLDFRGETFGAMGDLLALADQVTKLTAICSVCGKDTYCLTQRIINGRPAHYNDPIIMVGASQYEPRCRKCHIIRKD